MSDLRPNPPRLDPVPTGTEECGCCAGVERETPRAIDNRIGLTTIAHRIGTYAEFRASLIAGLSSEPGPDRLDLQTRADDDFTIGLLDAVACAADVLAFYQERIANESYLRTARERLSLQEMGRLIGYRLRPGVAAETWLAFTLETPPAPPPGLKPEPGMFVTGVPAEVTIDAGLGVRSVPAPGQPPQVFETVAPVTARPAWNAMQPWTSETARPGTGATFTYLAGVNTNLRVGDSLLFVGAEFLQNRSANQWDFRVLDRVAPDLANDRTFVAWRRPLGSVSPPQHAAAQPQAFALRQRAAVFGHNAPASPPIPVILRARTETDAAESILSPFVESAVSIVISPAASSIDLDTVYSTITPGSFVVLAKGAFNYPSEPAPPGTWVELYVVTTVTEISRQDFGLSAKVTRLALDGANYDLFANAIRETSVFAHSEPLPFAAYPVDDAVAGDTIPVAVSADGLLPGRRLLVRGIRQRDGAAIVHPASLVIAHAISASPARSVLEIDPPLPEALTRSSVVVHGNVALASHGESVTQILGAGNAATPFQRFELKQLPLTYRAAATELGAASELTVRVDDIAWKERDTLFGAASRDRVFTLVSDEQGRTFVQFGDGRRGTRLPTGVNNVRGNYRKGLGAAGNVGADTLTQLTARPLGLKGVSNPQAAQGGTDPEPAEQARKSMPLMTRTLGRAVSVLDYEDFARAFAGVAKARAQVLQLRGGPTVVITIAGPDGTAISPDSPIWINLRAALAASGDPHVAVRLLGYQAATFHAGLKVKCDPDREPKQVLAAVESALRARFGFDARDLGQPVQQSDVIAIAQGVPGVIAVDLDRLYGGTRPVSQTLPSRQTRLLANRMTVEGGQPRPDELLTLDPGPLDRLEVMP